MRFRDFGRLLFDWFRCPAVEITVAVARHWKIERVRACSLAEFDPEAIRFFRKALHRHTQRRAAARGRAAC